jgi:hypothetical protein
MRRRSHLSLLKSQGAVATMIFHPLDTMPLKSIQAQPSSGRKEESGNIGQDNQTLIGRVCTKQPE